MQCVAVCCSVLQCVAVCCSVLQCVAVCCSVLQGVAVCCSVMQCVAVCCSVLQCVAVCSSVLQCVAVCCSVLQCVAVCCRPITYIWRYSYVSHTHCYSIPTYHIYTHNFFFPLNLHHYTIQKYFCNIFFFLICNITRYKMFLYYFFFLNLHHDSIPTNRSQQRCLRIYFVSTQKHVYMYLSTQKRCWLQLVCIV